MKFNLVKFITANRDVAIAAAVFVLVALVNPFKSYGIIPLALAVGAFFAAKRYIK
jgi:hypothetical protein